ncbi:hypothetical protein D3C87_1962080 [compost metagenome]
MTEVGHGTRCTDRRRRVIKFGQPVISVWKPGGSVENNRTLILATLGLIGRMVDDFHVQFDSDLG